MRVISLLALGLALCACATPQQSCLRAATRDLRVIDRLIIETSGNIARGYALREEPVVVRGLEVCGRLDGRLAFCSTSELATRRVPQAVDLTEERRKLASLRNERAERNRLAAARVAQCEATYPEG